MTSPYIVDPDVPAREVVLAGRATALRAVFRDEENGALVHRRVARMDHIVLTAPSGRSLALEVVIDEERNELHLACLRAGFFEEQTTSQGLDPTGCQGWEIGDNKVAFQIEIPFPGSKYASYSSSFYDVSIDDYTYFQRHGHLNIDETDLQELLSETRAAYDGFMADTPDLAVDVRAALDRLQVDILRRQAFLLVEAAQQSSRDLLAQADDLEAALSEPAPAPRG